MKQLKKITIVIMALGIFSFCFCAESVKFDKMDVVRDDVVRSVGGLNNASIAAACEAKIDILRELLLRCGVRSEIPALSGTYMDRCGILQKSYTAEQLKRSGNMADFKYNVNQIINAYKAVKEEYAGSAVPLGEPADPHTSKRHHHLTKCPNRKGGYNTGGRRGNK